MKKWKDECDGCHTYKEDCHGYGGKILCPKCAKKLGYKVWGGKDVSAKGKNYKDNSYKQEFSEGEGELLHNRGNRRKKHSRS